MTLLPVFIAAPRLAPYLAIVVFALVLGACTPAPMMLDLDIGGERFRLELALTPGVRATGLMGRDRIADDGGMLFAYPGPRLLYFGMPHCRVPIDLLFLDAEGLALAVYTMIVEPPPGPGEPQAQYLGRLPRYGSTAPAQFAVELRGGRLVELGVGVGTRLILPTRELAAWAR